MTQWCYLLCNRKAEIIKGIPSGMNTGCTRGIGNLRSLWQEIVSNRDQGWTGAVSVFSISGAAVPVKPWARSAITCCCYWQSYVFIPKKLVWLEAVGLYFCVWCNFAGEIHGVTGVPRRHVDAHSCQHWYSLRGQNVCMKPELYLVNKEKFSYIWANKCQLHLSCVMFCSDVVEPDLIL